MEKSLHSTSAHDKNATAQITAPNSSIQQMQHPNQLDASVPSGATNQQSTQAIIQRAKDVMVRAKTFSEGHRPIPARFQYTAAHRAEARVLMNKLETIHHRVKTVSEQTEDIQSSLDKDTVAAMAKAHREHEEVVKLLDQARSVSIMPQRRGLEHLELDNSESQRRTASVKNPFRNQRLAPSRLLPPGPTNSIPGVGMRQVPVSSLDTQPQDAAITPANSAPMAQATDTETGNTSGFMMQKPVACKINSSRRNRMLEQQHKQTGCCKPM
ncbi:uncharacterized protein SETTUDRAFT_18710 [Exserohilum turcica Et28A]|uniref:Uncharacterized protein n=1 Tax=Exserohilum turcicum (strain 28A) TaxID=671987 RepID=R0J577_EXST2|nr:uncharacterized protein SETTUDRAFT_18710 [Exserohilum turcica Et28A]EOA92055.1 hypothetical protein SETTUDRAFT_18710 [Exserohilum turcica Et28A]